MDNVVGHIGVSDRSEGDNAGVAAEVDLGSVEDLGGFEQGVKPFDYSGWGVHFRFLSCKAT